MNIGSPTLALGLFQRATGELQPGVVEIVAPALGIGGPDQCRLAVRQLTEMTLALSSALRAVLRSCSVRSAMIMLAQVASIGSSSTIKASP